MKKRRQYVLEDAASWYAVSAFGEEGAEALRDAYRRRESARKDGDVYNSWYYKVLQPEKEKRENEEVIRVVDEESAKRMIEILNTKLTI